MSNTPYEREKNKSRPEPRTKGATGLMPLLTLVLLTPCLLVMVYIVIVTVAYNYKRSFFPREDAAETCRALAFAPESAFCTGAETQNVDNLKKILEQTYPVESTKQADLEAHFEPDITCDDGGFCEVHLPIGEVYLYLILDQSGSVKGYNIEDDRTAGPW